MHNIVPEAIFPPARCIVTSSPSGPFVDTGRAIQGYGRVYISVPYLRTLMRELDYVPAVDLAAAVTRQEELSESLMQLEAKVALDTNARVADVLEEAAATLRLIPVEGSEPA